MKQRISAQCFANGNRSASNGYSGDLVRQKFGSYERDIETGLDFAQARYFSNIQGRFTSPDPVGGHLIDPQTLAKYTYVRNNPLRFTDPSGLDFFLECKGNSDTCRNGHVGITTVDANGNKQFTPTLISNDKNGNLVDQNGNRSTGNFDEHGFHFADIEGAEFSGRFAANTAATTLSGAGIFDGFTRVFNSNGFGTNVAQGSLFGTAAQLKNLLGKLRGPNEFTDKLDSIFHPGDQYRGGNANGPDPHLSFEEPSNSTTIKNPNGAPDAPDFIRESIHFDNAFPFGDVSGFFHHGFDVGKFTLQRAVLRKQDIPPPLTIPK
jgi:RHS repeat-associated protein